MSKPVTELIVDLMAKVEEWKSLQSTEAKLEGDINTMRQELSDQGVNLGLDDYDKVQSRTVVKTAAKVLPGTQTPTIIAEAVVEDIRERAHDNEEADEDAVPDKPYKAPSARQVAKTLGRDYGLVNDPPEMVAQQSRLYALVEAAAFGRMVPGRDDGPQTFGYGI